MIKCCDPDFSPVAFKRRITFQVQSLVQNDSGGQDSAWADFGTYWASIIPTKSKMSWEKMFQDRMEESKLHEVRMRYVPGLDSSMRITYKGRTFQIKSILNVEENNQFLQIMALEGGTGT